MTSAPHAVDGGSVEKDLNSRPTAVYRFYDADDRLLYVGITHDLETRCAHHRALKPWWAEVKSRSVTWHLDRNAALAEETKAIAAESPKYNVVGSRNVHILALGSGNDRHRDPVATVRPSREAKDAATRALAERGWTLAEALLAAIGWILSDPDRALSELADFRPAPKLTGRPRKSR